MAIFHFSFNFFCTIAITIRSHDFSHDTRISEMNEPIRASFVTLNIISFHLFVGCVDTLISVIASVIIDCLALPMSMSPCDERAKKWESNSFI